MSDLDDFLKDPEGWIKREQARFKERRDDIQIDFERKRLDLHEGFRRQMADWQVELEQTAAKTRDWVVENDVDVDVPGFCEWGQKAIGENAPNYLTQQHTQRANKRPHEK